MLHEYYTTNKRTSRSGFFSFSRAEKTCISIDSFARYKINSAIVCNAILFKVEIEWKYNVIIDRYARKRVEKNLLNKYSLVWFWKYGSSLSVKNQVCKQKQKKKLLYFDCTQPFLFIRFYPIRRDNHAVARMYVMRHDCLPQTVHSQTNTPPRINHKSNPFLILSKRIAPSALGVIF